MIGVTVKTRVKINTRHVRSRYKAGNNKALDAAGSALGKGKPGAAPAGKPAPGASNPKGTPPSADEDEGAQEGEVDAPCIHAHARHARAVAAAGEPQALDHLLPQPG